MAAEAVALTQRQGSRLSTCFALLTRARAARLSGAPGSALEDLTAAAGAFRAGGARGHAGRLDAELAEHRP